ncbi:MAG TPA: GAF domain-containing sensor histidine kinase, partial [Candidatus Xenobia bacterium]
DAILQMALDVTGARYGIVRLLSPEATLVTGSVAGENLQRPLIEALALTDETITGWVASHAQPLCIADVREPPWNSRYYPLDRDREMRSELAVPLVGGGGQVEGVLNLESPRVGAFGEGDRLLLQALATQAVIAIQEARLLDALQDSAEHLLSWPCDRVLDRLADLARDLVGARAACIRTADAAPGAKPDLEVPIRTLGTLEVYGLARADAEWDRKVLGCLAHMAALAMDNEHRQRLLQHTLEQRTVAETFAAVGDVAANLLHQLNNKLGIIPLRVQGIEDKHADVLAGNAWLARQLAEIRKSAQEAMAAVRDNLSLLRPGQHAPVGLGDCIEQARRMLSVPSTFTVELHDVHALPKVNADARSLSMVFLNLFDNAATATAGAGQVEVHGRCRDGHVLVAVSDSGPGISRDLQDRIFEHSWSGRSGKLGFGLWWVRTLMTRLGGDITVDSDGRRGTTFLLSLPHV